MKRVSDADLRRDVYAVLAETLQNDLDSGADWINQDRGQPHVDSPPEVIERRLAVIGKMRDEFLEKSRLPRKR